jgi:hypothetical protein
MISLTLLTAFSVICTMRLKLLKAESVLVPIIQTGPDKSTAYSLDAPRRLPVAEKPA